MFNFDNTEIPTALDKRITELLKKLEATTDVDEYTKLTNNLSRLMDLRNNALKTQTEKTKTDNEKVKIENEKVKIENEKVKYEKDHSTDKEKIQIEKDKLQIDRDKIQIDRDKLDIEEAKFEDAQEARRSWKPSPDAVIGAAASVVGILFVLHYEKIGVITSKALGFVGKMTK